MNKKVLSLLVLFVLVFGYAIYQSVKLDNKLGKSKFGQTGTIVTKIPENLKLKTFPEKKIFNFKKEILNNRLTTVVHFWASWCGPCEAEFLDLTELTKSLESRSDLLFIFIAVNDEVKDIKKFLKNYSISKNVLILVDDENQAKRFGTYKLPETFVFSKQAKIIKKFSGQQPWTQKFLMDFFKDLM